MNDTQLYMVIGIPSFMVLLAWVTNLVQVNRLYEQNGKLADKIDRLAERLDSRIDKVQSEHHGDFKMLMEQIVSLNGRLSKVEN